MIVIAHRGNVAPGISGWLCVSRSSNCSIADHSLASSLAAQPNRVGSSLGRYIRHIRRHSSLSISGLSLTQILVKRRRRQPTASTAKPGRGHLLNDRSIRCPRPDPPRHAERKFVVVPGEPDSRPEPSVDGPATVRISRAAAIYGDLRPKGRD
jgi:hypothetical protein